MIMEEDKEIVVGMGDMKTARGKEVLATYALGSCIGLCIYDNVTKVGGLLHAMLPEARNKNYSTNPYRYVDTGVEELLKAMCARGANMRRMKAKLVGGAKMFHFKTTVDEDHIGARNVNRVHEILSEQKIPIEWEVTGGEVSRTIRFLPETGKVTIITPNHMEEII